jgi:2-haloacid dehalogenase
MPSPFSKDEIAACVFDAYGTLFDIKTTAGRWRDILGDKAEALAELWRSKQIEYAWFRSLVGVYEDFWHVTGTSLDAAMTTLGLNKDAALRSRLMSRFLQMEPHLDVKDVLQHLKEAGMRTATVSNGTVSMLVSSIKNAGLYSLVDERISADGAKNYKPHPAFYQLVAERLNLPAERICFLSSSAYDAAAASLYGFKAVWVNRLDQRREFLPAQALEISSLTRLPHLLGI